MDGAPADRPGVEERKRVDETLLQHPSSAPCRPGVQPHRDHDRARDHAGARGHRRICGLWCPRARTRSRETLDPDADQAAWSGYIESPTPRDLWGSEWGYSTESDEFALEDEEGASAGPTFDIWSYGPDKEDGTEDDIHLRTSAGVDDEFGGDLLAPEGP